MCPLSFEMFLLTADWLWKDSQSAQPWRRRPAAGRPGVTAGGAAVHADRSRQEKLLQRPAGVLSDLQ